MAEIELTVPGKNHESMAAEFIKEHLDNNEHDIHDGALKEKLILTRKQYRYIGKPFDRTKK